LVEGVYAHPETLFQHKRFQHDDWLDELKARGTHLKLWKDATTCVIALQTFVIKIMR
jgi:hypothetical protein